jgi:hypothetical protein
LTVFLNDLKGEAPNTVVAMHDEKKVTYRSKVSLKLTVPVTASLGGTAIFMAYQQNWIGLGLILLVLAVIAYTFLTTYYVVDGQMLSVKCGFFVDEKISISSIKLVKSTTTAMSAPALSLDRIVVTYRKYDTIVISPEDKVEFVDHLLLCNPAISVEL